MFKLLLILKYVRRKIAPLFAASAVTLCTAMVIIVISVMGGFLEMWRDTTKRLSGDVTISAGLTGFPHYEELIEALEADPQIVAATPVVYTFGLIRVDNIIRHAEIVGVQAASYDKVVAFKESLYWTPESVQRDLQLHSDMPEPERFERGGPRQFSNVDLVQSGMTFTPPEAWNSKSPGMVPGIVLYPEAYARDKQGNFSLHRNRMMGRDIVMTVVPMTEKGGLLEPSVKRFSVVNEIKSGFINYDQGRIFVSFELLQEMLEMNANEGDGEPVPARTTQILVRGLPTMSANEIRERVKTVVRPYISKYPELIVLGAKTWEEEHSMILGAVEKEKFLLVVLFAIISLVAFVMVMVTFYNIVLEKTRDIGVLRALGASRNGVAGLFLGYGMAIGIVGVAIGLLLASTIVNNINGLQTFLEDDLGMVVHYTCFVVAGALLGFITLFIISLFAKLPGKFKWIIWLGSVAGNVITGVGVWSNSEDLRVFWNRNLSIKIWDAQIYYFEQIPAKMDPTEVMVICIAAVLSSVFGSLVPALLAARQDPVEALRYE